MAIAVRARKIRWVAAIRGIIGSSGYDSEKPWKGPLAVYLLGVLARSVLEALQDLEIGFDDLGGALGPEPLRADALCSKAGGEGFVFED